MVVEKVDPKLKKRLAKAKKKGKKVAKSKLGSAKKPNITRINQQMFPQFR